MKVMHKKLWIASQLGIKRTKLVEIHAKGAFLIMQHFFFWFDLFLEARAVKNDHAHVTKQRFF